MWVLSGAPSVRRVNSGSRGFTLVVIRVRVGSLGRAEESSGSFDVRVGSLLARLGVIGFIRVHVRSLWCT